MIHWYDNETFEGQVEKLRDTDAERVEFIRRAAIAMLASQPGVLRPTVAWLNARKLWDAKPEDC